MFTTAARHSILLAILTLTLTAGCVDDQTSSTDRAIIETPCATAADCPAGFECEIEVEHGVTTTFCQSDDSSDGTCPAGYEAEIEHGQLFCQPHGGGSGGDDGGTGGTGGTGPTGAACTSDADCAVGLECEVEVEHGQTVSSCQPHGGT